MGLLQRFSPPAHQGDFSNLSGLAAQRHWAMSAWFDGVVAIEAKALPSGAKVQFYSPAKFHPGFPTIDQAITWNAFPKELLRQFGRERAYQEADTRAIL
jgi:hypothetical protein